MSQHKTAAEVAGRPTYSREQLKQYFDLVSLPVDKRRYSLDEPGDDLAYLRLLIKHQVVRVPFENLTQHYSWHKVIDPRPELLFRKIVGTHSATDNDGSHVPVGAGRGGYCMESNTFFHTILLSIGFDVYIAGARVYTPGDGRYLGLTHCVNIVTINNVRYLADVAFSANVAVAPLPLPDFDVHEEGAGPAHEHISPAKMRVIRAPTTQGLSRAQGHNLAWIYQIMYDYEAEKDDESKWITQYMFLDTEFFLEDIVAVNMYPAFHKGSFFTHKVMCVRFTTDLEGEEEECPGRAATRAVQEGRIDGNIIVFGDTLKWRRNGRTVLERKIEGERDRLDIFKKYFGLELDEQDVQAIVGTAGAL